MNPAKIITISAMDARKRFGEIMNRVSLRGDRFTVARAGTPLVRIVPIENSVTDIFAEPFATFDEWNDPANDPYDAL